MEITRGILSGKVALVTGGGSGIGKAVCQEFAKEGAKVVIADVNPDYGEETLSTLSGNDHITVTTDVSSSKSVQELFDAIRREYKRSPEIVVNSAEIGDGGGGILKQDENLFDLVIDVNLKGTYLVTRAAISGMLDDNVSGGSIVNISSLIVKTATAGHGLYAASKGGVVAFTKCVAKEMAKKGIRCNSILPGAILTSDLKKSRSHVAAPETFTKQIPMGRMSSAEEVADLCLFLASDRSSCITGSSLEISGGI